ncbi:MAG: alpha/beta hydrolase [Chloroflexota bacterium]
MEGKHVNVNGQNVYYEEYGQGDPLLLLHGGFGTGDSLLPIGQELAKHFRVIAPDRSSHGHTADKDGPLTYDSMTDETIGVIEALGLGKVSLFGYSDGAIICLLLALKRPDLIKKMVPLSANFHYNGLEPAMAGMMGSFTPEMAKMMLGEAVATYEKYTPDGPDHFPVVFEKTKAMFMTQPTLTVEDLAKITTPTLVLAGDHDLMTIEHTTALYKAIPGAQLAIIPNATHELAFSHAPDVSREALRFLQS